jgi:hypothetical protein
MHIMHRVEHHFTTCNSLIPRDTKLHKYPNFWILGADNGRTRIQQPLDRQISSELIFMPVP